MTTGLSRREQWALIGVVALIAVGLGLAAWGRFGREDARLVYIPGQGRWEKLADLKADASPATPAGVPVATGGDRQTSATAAGTGVGAAPAPALQTGVGLDINRATAEELDRLLPGIGPAKAGAIVAYRERAGRFVSLDDLEKVSGIGAATVERIRPFLTEIAPTSAAQAVVAATPSATPTTAPTAVAPAPLIDINTATAAELEDLPGVGPVLAARIVEERTANGPYRSPRDLERVQGIGPRNLEQMLPRIVAGPAR